MFEELIQGPASEPVTVVQQAVFSRFDAPDQLTGSPPAENPEYDDVLSKIVTAREQVEYLTRHCFFTQKWKLVLPCFPNRYRRFCDPVLDRVLGTLGQESIELIRRPVQSVDLITYLDLDGTEQTLDDSLYELAKDRIVLKVGQIWPVTAHRDDAVRISTTVGFDPEASPPNPIPERLLTAVKFLAHWYYENRVPASVQPTQDVMFTLTKLLKGFRVGYLPVVAGSHGGSFWCR